jgi:hypothetical protein
VSLWVPLTAIKGSSGGSTFMNVPRTVSEPTGFPLVSTNTRSMTSHGSPFCGMLGWKKSTGDGLSSSVSVGMAASIPDRSESAQCGLALRAGLRSVRAARGVPGGVAAPRAASTRQVRPIHSPAGRYAHNRVERMSLSQNGPDGWWGGQDVVLVRLSVGLAHGKTGARATSWLHVMSGARCSHAKTMSSGISHAMRTPASCRDWLQRDQSRIGGEYVTDVLARRGR